ncbi:hypothetical protein [Peptoniphilus stercorisuis]|uniref:Uncharacterized protein n=1 Tax=Peptoniphilus stercorisuis TaxID=1436965 RepID=A0ABS4KFB0_9FIRM|nr:hypothetical protein [Peptoniphilus stercorisuis]MBP2026070.1 hypothetical protein [Peptoniphilus stercorisuis]
MKYTKEDLLNLNNEELIKIIIELEENNDFFISSNSKLDEIKILIEEDCNDINNHLVDSQREMIDALNKKLFRTIDEKRDISKKLYDLKQSIK